MDVPKFARPPLCTPSLCPMPHIKPWERKKINEFKDAPTISLVGGAGQAKKDSDGSSEKSY